MSTALDNALDTWRIHPAANLFPLLEGEEFDALVDDIREHGLHEPVWVTPDGLLLDGRNRARACAAAGVPVDRRVYEGDKPFAFVSSLNVHRRHLTTGQRLRAYKACVEEEREAAKGRRSSTLKQFSDVAPVPQRDDTGRSSELAAEATGVSPRTARQFERVERASEPLAEAVLSDDVSAKAAESVVRDAPDLIPAIETGALEPREAVEEVKRRAHVAHNTGENEWYTPPEFIDAARTAMGGRIDVDPATSDIAQERVKAVTYYTVDDDGLAQEWCGTVWMNPPYAQPLIGQFVDHLAAQVRSGNTTQACVLVNNGTETAWGQKLLAISSAVCFPKGRIRFLDPEGKPGAPLQGQMIAYIGSSTNQFSSAFKKFGAVLTRG